MTKTVAVDFDGVLHWYRDGWKDGSIYDRPAPGAIEGVAWLLEHAAVFVFTSRADLAAVASWLNSYADNRFTAVPELVETAEFWDGKTWDMGEGVHHWQPGDAPLVLVTNRKLPAVAYLDDRAVPFTSWDYVQLQLRGALGLGDVQEQGLLGDPALRGMSADCRYCGTRIHYLAPGGAGLWLDAALSRLCRGDAPGGRHEPVILP